MPDCVHAFVQWLHEWQDFFGGFLGGLVGAVGAIYAVYLTLRKQRKDETNNVTSAVVTEVTALAKYVVGAVEVCIEVAKGERRVPQTDAAYIVRKLFAPPTVYNAVADRIGLLPHPDVISSHQLQTCSSLLCSWRDRSLPTPQSPGRYYNGGYARSQSTKSMNAW